VPKTIKKPDKIVTYNDFDNYHSYDDLPAVTYKNGTQCWYRYGLLHRKNGPAVILPIGICLFYNNGELIKTHPFVKQKAIKTYNENGKLHSYNDLPAVTTTNGSKWWYKNGELHRDNDLPAVVFPTGTKEWWLNGKFIKDEKNAPKRLCELSNKNI